MLWGIMNLTTTIKRFGFTLAEVLIVIGIIGIVANMTIPTLIDNVQEQSNIIVFKRVYSDINSVIKDIIAENGTESLAGVITQDDDTFTIAFKKYLAVDKICGAGATNGICFHSNSGWRHLNKTAIDGTAIEHEVHDSQGVVLTNGVIMKWCTRSTCTPGSPECMFLFVDVNGFKGPNIVGKDIFAMRASDIALFPLGTKGDGFENSCNKSDTGYGCSAQALLNGTLP